MGEFSFTIAFVAGLISFLSPCILPIIPGFLAYLGGSTAEGGQPKKKDIFLASVFFVLGFSTIFSVLGVVLNTILESVAYDAQVWLARIGGVLIIFFGLYLVGLIKVAFLEREFRLPVKMSFKSRYLTAFVFGAAFAAGWTPCVGAVLGGILGLAASAPGSAFILLLAYSLGLGLPFLLVGAFASQAPALINASAKWFVYVQKVFGVVLIILGILAFTQNLQIIASFDVINQFLLNESN